MGGSCEVLDEVVVLVSRVLVGCQCEALDGGRAVVGPLWVVVAGMRPGVDHRSQGSSRLMGLRAFGRVLICICSVPWMPGGHRGEVSHGEIVGGQGLGWACLDRLLVSLRLLAVYLVSRQVCLRWARRPDVS